MIAPFTLGLPARVFFGRGSADAAVPDLVALGQRLLLVRSASVPFADHLAARLRAAGCSVAVETARGEPRLSVLEALRATHRDAGIEAVIAVGGGSAIDLGKALAALLPATEPALAHLEVVGEGRPLVAAPLPFAALPSTAGTGAEATRNAVIAVEAHARKVSLRDPRMMATLVVVDPALTDGCPAAVTLASGLDAITQVIEPWLSRRANPFTDALCEDAIPRGLRALRRLMQTETPEARDTMCHVSLIGGIALANAGLGAVHGLAGVLGGLSGVPHGVLCGALLVPTLRANRAAMQAAGLSTARIDRVEAEIGAAFDVSPADALGRFEAWMAEHGLPAPAALVDPALVAQAARDSVASSSMKTNPVALDEVALARILTDRRAG